MNEHEIKFTKLLKGKVIKQVTYMDDENMEGLGWNSRPAVIEFTDGTALIPMSDDEGNEGGALSYADEKDGATIYTT